MLKRASNRRNFDFDRKSIGFWMETEGANPQRFVRVFVTYEALSAIDPSQVRDRDGALETFDKNGERIDVATNSKFDAGEVEDELYEAQPVIILRSTDF